MFERVQVFYDRRRCHSGLGFLNPAQACERIATHLIQVSAPAGEAHSTAFRYGRQQ
jgi:hypothetical protein